MEWIPPAIFQSSCTIDVTYFPFDQQKCVMKFGSWTFNGDQVALKLHNDWVDLSDYWKSGTWDIVEVPAYLNVYNGTKNGKPTETDISFYITIRRKTLFYTVNLILPTLLISFLCILVFYLPAEAGQSLTHSNDPSPIFRCVYVDYSFSVYSILPFFIYSILFFHSLSILFFFFLFYSLSSFDPGTNPIYLEPEPNDERTKRSETGMAEMGTTGEKVTLGISILLSLVVFLLLVSKILPPTSLVLPLIAKYLLFTFVMNCISILATVIIINWNFRGPRTHKMPNWVRTVFLKYLPIVLLIRRPKKTRLRWMMDMPSMGVHYHPYDHQQQMMQQQQSSPLYPLSPPAEQGINTNNGFSNNMVNTGTVSSCKDAPSSFNNFRSRKDSQVVLDYSCLDVPSPPVPTSLQHLQHPSPPVPASLQHLQHPGQQMLQHHPSCTISQGHIHNRTVEHLMHQTASSSTASPLGLAGSGLARSINGHGDPRRYSLDGGGGGATCEGIGKMMGEGEDDSVDTLYLTPEAYRATEAIEFIAGHLRSEDEYIQVRLKSSLSTFHHPIHFFCHLFSSLLSLTFFSFIISLSHLLSLPPFSPFRMCEHTFLFHYALFPFFFFPLSFIPSSHLTFLSCSYVLSSQLFLKF